MGTLQMRATLPFLLLTCTIVLHPRVSPRKGQHLLCTEGSDWTLPWDWSVHSFLETNPFYLISFLFARPRVSPRKGIHLLCTEGSDWTLTWACRLYTFRNVACLMQSIF